MNLATSIVLYADGSSLINRNEAEDIRVKDTARRRLIKTNPDVDGAKDSPDSQADNAGFIGKKYRVQDTKYGHYISEHDSSTSAEYAATGRPYSRVLRHTEWSQTQKSRDMARKKLIQGGGPGSGRHKEILTKLGYQHQGEVKEGKVKADLFRHPNSTRTVLLHKSGAWSSKKQGDITNGTHMKDFYSHYHLARADQAVVHGHV